MVADDSIVRPVKGKKTPDLGPVAVMVSSTGDLEACCRRMNIPGDAFIRLLTSRLYVPENTTPRISLTGPMIGAPYATMLLENLIAWGAKKILYFGWCGAVSPLVGIGDIILPTGAFIDEGTSGHYRNNPNRVSLPSSRLTAPIRSVLNRHELTFHEGAIWTTDAIYRETRTMIESIRAKNVLAIEMEMSAIFTVAHYRRVDIGAIAIVSDDVSGSRWRPGFGHRRFKQSRRAVCEVLEGICEII